jgi:Xaa-Pro dipeptidase
MNLLTRAEVETRLRRFQSWMAKSSVDAVFVMQNADLYYFAGTVQVGVLCLPACGEPLYLVQKSLERARLESPWERLLPSPGMKQIPDLLSTEGLGNCRTIGLELDVLPASYYLRFQDLFPHTRFVDASDAIRKTRMIKSPYEVEQTRKAAALLAQGFDALRGWIRTGVTELEVSSRLEGFLRLQGHQGITRMRGFNSEIAYGPIASGPSSSHPTCFNGPVGFVGLYPAVPNGSGKRRLAAGDTVVADIVGGVEGYLADKTRTYALGEPVPDLRRAHQFTLDLLGEIEGMLRPGVVCSQIYQYALTRAEDSPYAQNFMGAGGNRVRFVGHGLGLELDEPPVLAANFDIPLEAGMTIAIEPKMFFPQRGGVGIENTYLITASGFEKLTKFPEDLIVV